MAKSFVKNVPEEGVVIFLTREKGLELLTFIQSYAEEESEFEHELKKALR